MARVIDTSEVIPVISELAMKACYELSDSLLNAFPKAYDAEESPYGRDIPWIF
jgi:tartrate dehydratase alpha subunit/fumarate hydratase class I-like protein